MKSLITLLFWGTLFVVCFYHFIVWSVPFVASPFVALLALIAIALGAGRSSSQ